MQDPLTREICVKILEYLGVLPYFNFGQTEITHFQVPSQFWITLEYETGQKLTHPIYAACTNFSEVNFQVLLLDLSIVSEQYLEFYVIFRLNQLPLHCLHYVAGQEIKGEIIVFDANRQNWIPTTIQIQASNLIGFDTLHSQGIFWSPLSEIQELRQSIIDLLNQDNLNLTV